MYFVFTGRFDDDVIEERRQSAAALLNFISTQPHLYKSLVFKQFLEVTHKTVQNCLKHLTIFFLCYFYSVENLYFPQYKCKRNV